MKVTLLMTMIWAARSKRLPGEGGAGPSVVDTDRLSGSGHGVRAGDVEAPFQCPPEDISGLPARLADGLGLESTPVRVRTCAP